MDYVSLIKGILLQLVVFCSIPLVYWFIRRRKEIPFFRYVGLTPVKKSSTSAAIAAFALIYLAVYGIVHFVPAISALTQPSANAYTGTGATAIIPALFVCFIQQALAEEVLFRGFAGKRLIAKLGFPIGNAAQAALFGFLHVMFSISSGRDLISYLIIFTSITAGGWLLGYLDEKLCGGSIVPGILLHGLGNYIMIMIAAFPL